MASIDQDELEQKLMQTFFDKHHKQVRWWIAEKIDPENAKKLSSSVLLKIFNEHAIYLTIQKNNTSRSPCVKVWPSVTSNRYYKSKIWSFYKPTQEDIDVISRAENVRVYDSGNGKIGLTYGDEAFEHFSKLECKLKAESLINALQEKGLIGENYIGKLRSKFAELGDKKNITQKDLRSLADIIEVIPEDRYWNELVDYCIGNFSRLNIRNSARNVRLPKSYIKSSFVSHVIDLETLSTLNKDFNLHYSKYVKLFNHVKFSNDFDWDNVEQLLFTEDGVICSDPDEENTFYRDGDRYYQHIQVNNYRGSVKPDYSSYDKTVSYFYRSLEVGKEINQRIKEAHGRA